MALASSRVTSNMWCRFATIFIHFMFYRRVTLVVTVSYFAKCKSTRSSMIELRFAHKCGGKIWMRFACLLQLKFWWLHWSVTSKYFDFEFLIIERVSDFCFVWTPNPFTLLVPSSFGQKQICNVTSQMNEKTHPIYNNFFRSLTATH